MLSVQWSSLIFVERFNRNEKTVDKKNVVEIAQFRLMTDVSEQEFLKEVEISQKSFLEK